MTKSFEETEIPAPRRRKDEQTKSWLGRVAESMWHYALTLVFVALIAAGIWSRPNFAAEMMNFVAILGLAGAGLAMCFAMTKISKNQRLAFVTAVIYLVAPILLENFYARMSLAEGAVMIAMPILLLGLYQMTAHEKHAARYLAIAATMMIFANGALAMMMLAMAAIYALLNAEKMVNFGVIWRIILATIVTLGLTAGFVEPLAETWLGENESFSQEFFADYTGATEISGAEMNERRVRPQALIDFDYAAGGYGAALGVMALVGVIGFCFVWRMFEEKTERIFATTLYLIGVAAVVLATPAVDWENLPSVAYAIQNPEKILMIAAATLSVVAGYTIFALVRRTTAEKQAVFVVIVGAFAIFSVAQIIMPAGDENYLDGMRAANETLAGVGAWLSGRVGMVSEVISRGYTDLQPMEIATLVSAATAGLGVIWVMISGVRDLLRRRKQRQVDSLIDSVWEAMAETENAREATKKKTKRAQAEKPQEKLLPEPPEPEIPGLNLSGNEAAGLNSDTMVIPTAAKTTKKPARKKKSTKKAEAKPKVDDEEKVAAKKTTRTTVRSTTTKMKHIKAEPETPEKNEETKPRVTKVKAGTKKEA